MNNLMRGLPNTVAVLPSTPRCRRNWLSTVAGERANGLKQARAEYDPNDLVINRWLFPLRESAHDFNRLAFHTGI